MLPNLDDIALKLADATIFSTLDARGMQVLDHLLHPFGEILI